MIRLHHHRRHTANHSWHLDLPGQRLFVKANPNRADAEAAIAGHRRLQDHFPLPRLRVHLPLGRWAITVYDRHTSGLLLDTITDADHTGDLRHLNTALDRIIGTYRAAYATGRLVPASSVIDKLYRDRVAPGGRLGLYYDEDPILLALPDGHTLRGGEISRSQLIVNGVAHHLDLTALRAQLRHDLAPPDGVWAAISHGDPTDLNIGIQADGQPIWFDHDTSGLTPIAGEIACFLMYQRLHGSLLVPRYNPAAYADHPKARTFTPATVTVHHQPGDPLTIDYAHQPSPARRHTIHRYIQELVQPVAGQLGISDVLDWLRPYLVMRLLAVYNIADLDISDTALSLALTAQLLGNRDSLDDILGLETEGSCQ